MIGILDEIKAFCEVNNIPFFLTGGTLLGAIRHKGFIPWDDDIDIAMLRKDYDRFVHNFESVSGNIKILTRDFDKGYRYTFAKAVDDSTLVIEDNDEKFPIGVYVDVFPIDSLDNNLEKCKKLVRRHHRWQKVYQLKYLHISKVRNWKKNALLLLIKPFLRLLPDSFYIKRLQKLKMQFENNTDSKYVANLCGAWGEKEIVSRSVFNSSVSVNFENKTYPAPIGYDELLKNLYKDYMKFPPIDKQISHHNYKAYKKTNH